MQTAGFGEWQHALVCSVGDGSSLVLAIVNTPIGEAVGSSCHDAR